MILIYYLSPSINRVEPSESRIHEFVPSENHSLGPPVRLVPLYDHQSRPGPLVELSCTVEPVSAVSCVPRQRPTMLPTAWTTLTLILNP